ncbi:neprilysin, partial [Aphelenchoides avenae]
VDNPEPHFIDQVRKNSTAYKLELSLFANRWAQATGKSIDNGVLAREVEQVARLEEDIADILHPTAETVTNSLDTNNKFRVSQLNELFPLEVDWSDVLLSFTPAYLGDYIRNDPEVIVTDPEYIRELGSVLARYEPRTVFNYAWWQYIVDKLIRPTSKFTGTSTEICVDLTSLVMPEAVDSLYFDLILPQDDSDDLLVDAIFGDVRAAMLAVLDELSWLDERSRERARQKACFRRIE